MSRESPEYHPPRISANGPVLIGIVRLEGTCYGILDAEATWRGLRSAVGRWSGLISESKLLLRCFRRGADRSESRRMGQHSEA